MELQLETNSKDSSKGKGLFSIFPMLIFLTRLTKTYRKHTARLQQTGGGLEDENCVDSQEEHMKSVLYTPRSIPYGFHMEWVDSMDSRWNDPWIPCGMVDIPWIPYGMGQFHGLHMDSMNHSIWNPWNIMELTHSIWNPWNIHHSIWTIHPSGIHGR
jgi:hypothetical protein